MSSILERVSKSMIKNLGGKDLTPVKCVLDATKFRQFSILRKKTSFWPWGQSDDIPVEYSLMDILEPSSSFPECVRSGPFHTKDFETKKLKADVGVNAGAEVRMSGEIAQSHKSNLEIQSVSVPKPNLEMLQNRKLLEPEPSFLSVCRRRGDNLYVVTEAVELAKDTVLYDNSSVNVSGKVSLPQVTYVKGECQGEGQRVREKTMTVPQGTVLAYRKKQLVIKDKNCTILIFDDTKQKTFQNEQPTRRYTEEIQLYGSSGLFTLELSPILPIGHFLILFLGRLAEPFGQDFSLLQEEVSENLVALAWVPKNIQDVLFHSILALLGDRESLKNLMDMMESDNLGHLEGPGGKILNELRQESSPPWVNLGYLIFYLLEVLLELSDTQLVLLTQAVEKRILSQQQELVRSILEPNFRYPWHIPITLPAELLALLQEEDMQITYALLEECGLKMELRSPRSTWHLDAKKPLSALYAALSMLLQLAEASVIPGGQPVQGGLAHPSLGRESPQQTWEIAPFPSAPQDE
ncbi:gasdermin-C [Fukomys damarensis]|uniref:gasdermin-C n=1 Tax=Fukomys damarensis TaxID=885580 RepID=UPI0014551850|nr:gasdermin-C [Fukomys damarensis]